MASFSIMHKGAAGAMNLLGVKRDDFDFRLQNEIVERPPYRSFSIRSCESHRGLEQIQRGHDPPSRFHERTQ